MKKQKNKHKSYKGISGLERKLLSLIRERDLAVFDTKRITRLSGMKKTQVYQKLHSLHKKGLLSRPMKNYYIFKENIPGREFEISTEIVKPSYLSFWSALSYYGFTEQQPQTIQLVSNKQSKDFKFNNHKVSITTFDSSRFFGYLREKNFTIAEKEKCLIDSLSSFDKVGGINEFSKCLSNSWDEIDKNKLLSYLFRFNNKSMVSRMGFLIEQLALKLSPKLLKELDAKKSKSFVKLNPSKERSNNYEKNWKININTNLRKEEIV